MKKYESFISEWHYFLLELQGKLLKIEEEKVKAINMFLLQSFFLEPYKVEEDFYEQFDHRMRKVKQYLHTSFESY